MQEVTELGVFLLLYVALYCLSAKLLVSRMMVGCHANPEVRGP